MAFWPLTLFSFGNGFIVFTLISHLCLLGSMWLIITRLIPLPERLLSRTLFLCLAIVYTFGFDAVHTTLELGQINLVVLFLICLSLVALQEKASDWRIAFPLTIAILLKTYPAFLLILLAARRRFKAAALTLACCGILVALAGLVIPRDVWASWLTEVVPAASNTKALILLFSHTPLDFTWNQSIAGFMKRLFGDTIWGQPPLSYPALAAPLTTIAEAVVVGITSLFAFRFYKRVNPVAGVADDTAAFLLMMYLVAPLSWDHHLVFVLPSAFLALVFIVNGLTVNGSLSGKAAFGLALILCVLAWRVPLDTPIFKKHWWTLLGFVKLYAVAALWIFFTVRLARTPSRVPDESVASLQSHSLQPQL
jgi:alpha-1,2-mannosyltransferase